MKKGRNLGFDPSYAFDNRTKDRQCFGVGGAVGINAPIPAWTPGSPLRGTNCCCRRLHPRVTTRQVRLWVWSLHSAVPREPRGPRPGIDRSLRTRDLNSNSLSSLLVSKRI